MPEYIDKEKYCAEVCKCNKEKCDKSKCTIWNAPAADVVEVVYAHWENCDWVEPYYHGCGTIRIPNAGMKCTNCVHVFKKDLLWKDNYCPNCGAKMRGEE